MREGGKKQKPGRKKSKELLYSSSAEPPPPAATRNEPKGTSHERKRGKVWFARGCRAGGGRGRVGGPARQPAGGARATKDELVTSRLMQNPGNVTLHHRLV